MERLTTNRNVSEMGMYELAHNSCYSKEGLARYRDFEMDMDARDFARNLMTTLANEDMPLDDDLFDEEIMENLIYDPFSDIRGLIALFYRNLWAMADLRERLKNYEDAEEQGLLRLPCKVGDVVYTIYQHKIVTGRLKRISIRKEGASFFAKFNGFPIESLLYEDYFGKTIFLSIEEAEKALADMGV